MPARRFRGEDGAAPRRETFGHEVLPSAKALARTCAGYPPRGGSSRGRRSSTRIDRSKSSIDPVANSALERWEEEVGPAGKALGRGERGKKVSACRKNPAAARGFELPQSRELSSVFPKVVRFPKTSKEDSSASCGYTVPSLTFLVRWDIVASSTITGATMCLDRR
ncbi:hypothetical protein KM043_011647 [Ampulex compressa]|nr:hypothetical protein KM043_011647 [Ampulex compressa]